MRSLVRDESGITMVLAMLMVVLIGVMGAGLLVFVQTELTTALRVNQGQRAFDMADAGVQAAKRQLIIDAAATHYDGTPNPESDWSYAGTGKTLSLGNPSCNNCISVKIQYLLPAFTDAETQLPNYAPVRVPSGDNYPPGVDYFKITSQGTVSGARRKVEAIYVTQKLGAAQAYYAGGNITVSGNITLEGLSMFAMGTITGNSSVNVPTTLSDGSPNTDNAYGNWYRRPWNTLARTTDLPGFGAPNAVTGTGSLNVRDFGSNSSPTVFVEKDPPNVSNGLNQISFPFDYTQQPNLDDLLAAAQLQGKCYGCGRAIDPSLSSGTVNIREATATGTGPKWPANSTVETVVYLKFGSYASTNKVNWDVESATGSKGTLVVENGTLEMNVSNAAHPKCLKGVAIVRVPDNVPTSTFIFTNTGQGCLEGFVNANKSINIAGTIKPFTLERGNRPGFYGLQLWSWRELFQ